MVSPHKIDPAQGLSTCDDCGHPEKAHSRLGGHGRDGRPRCNACDNEGGPCETHVRTYPHMHCDRSAPKGTDWWRCADCGKGGVLDDLMGPNAVEDCTKEHAACPSCGFSPECAEDCNGIAAVLGRDDVYVAGVGDAVGEA